MGILKNYIEEEQKNTLKVYNSLLHHVVPYEFTIDKLLKKGIIFKFKKDPDTCVMREIIICSKKSQDLSDCITTLEDFIQASATLLKEYEALKSERKIKENIIFQFAIEKQALAQGLYFEILKTL